MARYIKLLVQCLGSYPLNYKLLRQNPNLFSNSNDFVYYRKNIVLFYLLALENIRHNCSLARKDYLCFCSRSKCYLLCLSSIVCRTICRWSSEANPYRPAPLASMKHFLLENLWPSCDREVHRLCNEVCCNRFRIYSGKQLLLFHFEIRKHRLGKIQHSVVSSFSATITFIRKNYGKPRTI